MTTPNPNSSPRASLGVEVTGGSREKSRAASFNTDGGQPSVVLRNAFACLDNASMAEIRVAAPRVEATIFLHNVTGLTDVWPSRDAFDRVTGVRARAAFGDRAVFIGLTFEGA